MVTVVYFAGKLSVHSLLIDQQVTKMFIRGIFIATSQIRHVSRIHLFGQIDDL